jgi:hypothetical protein
MKGGTLPANVKRTSALRRVPPLAAVRYRAVRGQEGDVCAFQLQSDSGAIAVEAAQGRAMMLAPGDVFLATPGYRESTRWVVGGIPAKGLVPGTSYWVLSDSGIVGELLGDSPRDKGHLGQAKFLGVVHQDGKALNIGQFVARGGRGKADHGAPLFLVLGTSAEVGKTTAGIAIIQSLRRKGYATIVTLKAGGTSSVGELSAYLDFGAAQAFDCVDFGLPSTYPSERAGIDAVFTKALDVCLSLPADAVLIECGGDILGANVPVFLQCLRRKRAGARVILAASDVYGALGAKRILGEMGLSVDLITGLCTDTPTLRQRTEARCGIPAVNLSRGGFEAVPF